MAINVWPGRTDFKVSAASRIRSVAGESSVGGEPTLRRLAEPARPGITAMATDACPCHRPCPDPSPVASIDGYIRAHTLFLSRAAGIKVAVLGWESCSSFSAVPTGGTASSKQHRQTRCLGLSEKANRTPVERMGGDDGRCRTTQRAAVMDLPTHAMSRERDCGQQDACPGPSSGTPSPPPPPPPPRFVCRRRRTHDQVETGCFGASCPTAAAPVR